MTAIEGLGGIGKTQVALEAAYQVRHGHPDCSIYWVPAVDATSFENAYRDIGKALQIPRIDDDNADVKTLVKAALSEEIAGNWLLIIDNADDLKLLFGDAGLLNYLPFSRKGSILLTTRNREVPARLDVLDHIITLNEMSDDEAIKLLRQGLNASQLCDKNSTSLLLQYLANLPLAIKQASAYMSRTRISSTKYFAYCQSSDKTSIELLSKDFQDQARYKSDQHQNPIATTWLISFDHISRDKPLAARYLKFICCLAEKDIPESLLPKNDNELEIDEAIGTLKGYAFIQERENQDSFDIHRLVRLATRNWLEIQGEKEKEITYTIQGLSEKFPFPEHENEGLWKRYLPHAQTALEFRDECTDQTALGNILFNVGEGNYRLGKYLVAEKLYRQTLELKEKVLGREHPDTLSSMNNLAMVLEKQGNYIEAEEIHRQKLELKEKVLAREHPSTLGSMNNLATVLGQQEKYIEAEEIYRQTLELKEKVLGREHPSTLASMNNLATVLGQQEKYIEAEEIYRQTLELQEKVLGREHP